LFDIRKLEVKLLLSLDFCMYVLFLNW